MLAARPPYTTHTAGAATGKTRTDVIPLAGDQVNAGRVPVLT